MAGRNISVDHEALGTIRVMRTIGMMGEVVGKAACICVKHNCTPRDVYASYLDELKELMNQPGPARRATVHDADRPERPAALRRQRHRRPGRSHSRKAERRGAMGIDPKKLPGIVVDDAQAKLTGEWSTGAGLPGYVGTGYRYASPATKGAAARFEFTVPAAGNYEVRFRHTAHENRSTAVTVTVVERRRREVTSRRTSRQAGPLEHGFVVARHVRLHAGQAAGAVVVTADGARRNIAIDAVQVVPAK